MHLEDITWILENALKHEGLLGDGKYKALLAKLKTHITSKKYCTYLGNKCDDPKALKAIKVELRRVPAQIIEGKWGRRVSCPDGRVITRQCGAGSNDDCSGSWSWAYCESFESPDKF